MSEAEQKQLERAREVIAELRKRVVSLQSASVEPVAVVGMACRFPGEASDCEGYWRMIAAGGDAVGAAPAQRVPDLGVGATKPAAYVKDIESFDAGFFEISPREAAYMDPQQRLFLEVAWEALEDAGQTRAALAKSLTSVFVGVHNLNNGYLELQTSAEGGLSEYTPTGAGHDVIGGRLAYLFDLRGPTVAVNTACSSSLVAVHLACQSLLSRDSRMAVAGGVSLIMGPKQGQVVHLGAMLAPDGRCKTFDSRANGYGRGEGCGVVVLKRLSDALADRDRVLAVIRGSAINQDGRTNGLTAPNGLAQQELLRRALQRAGLEAARVGYVEAHGTGTALGDPIEVEAVAEVYGSTVPTAGAGKCYLGSAKANVNHLEGAAGIAGFIKAVLTIRARRIPPVAGLKKLNPHFSLEGTKLSIPTEAIEWQTTQPRVAGVSAFGWSGVNCHVILEEAPVPTPTVAMRPTLLLVSASSHTELSARAAALAEALAHLADEELESFAYTATVRRTHYEHRIAVAGETRAELAGALRRMAQMPAADSGKKPAAPAVGLMIGDDVNAVSAQGRELFAQEPAFRAVVEACAAEFASAGQTSVADDLHRGFQAGAQIDGMLKAARLLAFAAGVHAMLRAWGVPIAAVHGLGAGTAAARYLSGASKLADTVRLIAQRQQIEVDQATALMQSERSNVTHRLRLDAAGGSGRLHLMRFLADLATGGAELAFDAMYAPQVRVTALPAHRFRRRRHWLTATPSAEAAVPATQSWPAPKASPATEVSLAASEVAASAAPATGKVETALRKELRDMHPAQRKGRMSEVIAGEVRKVMELAAEDSLNSERGFFDLGMDSMMTVTLGFELEELFGISLPSTVAIDYPSVAALTGHLYTVLGFETAPQAPVDHPAADAGDGNSKAPLGAGAPEQLADDEVGAALAAELAALESELAV